MKQHSKPLFISNDICDKLEQISCDRMEFSEDYIQKLCFNHPNLLPIDEIEPIYNGLIPICRELAMPSGYCDVAYINDSGLITLVECKLWKNPESRRKVIGQIIDYAKDLASWDYEKFQEHCLKARNKNETQLVDIVKQYSPDVDEAYFVDQVNKNLMRGRFLLLIIGDGIRENMEDMVRFMNDYSKLSFTLSLVELPIFKIKNSDNLIVTPRILIKTVEVIRNIFTSLETKTENYIEKQEVTSSSEIEFYSRLQSNIGSTYVNMLKDLLINFNKNYSLHTKLGRGKRLSLNIKTSDDLFNLASIQENGEVWFYGILSKAQEMGNKKIGDNYLEILSKEMEAEYDKNYTEWNWCVKRDGKYLNITEYIDKKEKWDAIIQNFLKEKSQIEE